MGPAPVDGNLGNVVLTAAQDGAQVLKRSSAEELDLYYITLALIGVPEVREGRTDLS